jgi:hypothetical protein
MKRSWMLLFSHCLYHGTYPIYRQSSQCDGWTQTYLCLRGTLSLGREDFSGMGVGQGRCKDTLSDSDGSAWRATNGRGPWKVRGCSAAIRVLSVSARQKAMWEDCERERVVRRRASGRFTPVAKDVLIGSRSSCGGSQRVHPGPFDAVSAVLRDWKSRRPRTKQLGAAPWSHHLLLHSRLFLSERR